MALSGLIAEKGYTPEMIETTATVTLSKDTKGPFISKIELQSEVNIPYVDDETLQSIANEAKLTCYLLIFM